MSTFDFPQLPETPSDASLRSDQMGNQLATCSTILHQVYDAIPNILHSSALPGDFTAQVTSSQAHLLAVKIAQKLAKKYDSVLGQLVEQKLYDLQQQMEHNVEPSAIE